MIDSALYNVQLSRTIRWDAEEEARIYNIQAAKAHRLSPHSMVHAYISWQQADRYVELFKDFYNKDITNPYSHGLVWFCCKCFKIECPHWFDSHAVQRVGDRHYHVEYNVCHCKFCNLNIFLGGPGVGTPSQEALALVHERLAKHSPSEHRSLVNFGYGSGWVCETPVIVSRMIESHGIEAASVYLDRLIQNGSCQDAFNHLHNYV